MPLTKPNPSAGTSCFAMTYAATLLVDANREFQRQAHVQESRKRLSLPEYMQEYATVHIKAARQSGHSTAAMTLAESNHAPLIIPHKRWGNQTKQHSRVHTLSDLRLLRGTEWCVDTVIFDGFSHMTLGPEEYASLVAMAAGTSRPLVLLGIG